ncbi:MAG: protein kinase domain-containing protein [Gemmatimonadaceae bacterium]
MAELLTRLQAALADRYVIERELGRGGMATVFLARDGRHDRHVAVKVLHPELAAVVGPGRFRREIQIVTSLSHPHVLPLYDSGEADGQLYYVMPFVEGESLRARLDREHQLPIDEALRVVCEVASALDHAHRRGVVHRDIKPENILLEDGHAVVADFGIARALSDGSAAAPLTQTGIALGTPLYMSPEQSFADKAVDGRSDQYSLACVLYEMLVGQPPFVGPNAQAIMARHSLEAVPSLQVVRASVPDDVEDVIVRALSKSPADRFATVAQFADALRACGTHSTSARRVERRLTRRRVAPRGGPRWRVSALLAAILPLLAGGWAAWRFWLYPAGAAPSYAAGALDPRRVAVLYFDDVSGGGRFGYVADGLTEALIDQLEQVRALDVVSRNGVVPFRGADAAPDSVARVLGVGTIVKGSVEEVGDRLRVSVRLIDGNSGVDLKRKRIEQPEANVLAARDSVAQEVADFLRQRVGEEVRLRNRTAGTRDAVAWELLQRAERLQRDGESAAHGDDTTAALARFAGADSLLAQAEARDPRWPDPITMRGAIDVSRVRARPEPLAARPWIEQGLGHAARALALGPKDADALELRGTLRYLRWALALAPSQRDADALLRGAEEDLKAATALDPSKATAYSVLSQVYDQKDDMVEAKLAAQRAYEEDAYLTGADRVVWRLFATSYDLEQFADAAHWCEEGQRRFPTNPRFVRCRLWLFTTNARTPDVPEAWREVDALKKVTPPKEWPYSEREALILVGATLARAGQPDSARRVLERARAGADVDPQRELLTFEAFARTLLGTEHDRAEAFRLLRTYVAANPAHRAGFAESQSWWWKSLRDDPRYTDLVGGARR